MAGPVEVQMRGKVLSFLDGSMGRQFATAAREALDEAAARATKMSRSVFADNLKHREAAAPRKGRPTTDGAFPRFLNWVPTRTGEFDEVSFDYLEIESKAPYWIVQEVGTNRSFSLLGAGAQGYTGRVKSQKGRSIPFGLQWGIGGAYVRPGGFDNAQLQPLSGLRVAKGEQVHRLKIHREIEGKHFVRLGGQEGFRFYESNLRSEFRRIFQ